MSKAHGSLINAQQVAATALFLATKVEEHCRKVRELVIACCRVAQKNPNLKVDENTKDYWRWRDTIILNEDVLLELLCFDLAIESPYNILFGLLQYYGVEKQKKLRDSAWSFINDSNMTQTCLLFTSRTIACAALWFAAKQTGIAFSDDQRGRPWWEVQRVPLKQIRKALNYMADFYTNAPSGFQLKPGSESIYAGLRSPPDADDLDDNRTRLMKEQTPVTPVPMERSGSEMSLKREREDDGMAKNGNGIGTSANGHPSSRIPAAASMSSSQQQPDERGVKRIKLDDGSVAAATTAPPATTIGNGTSAAENDDDAGSEEGEVEE
jgi:protein BUR2